MQMKNYRFLYHVFFRIILVWYKFLETLVEAMYTDPKLNHHIKVCSEKKFTHIFMYYENSVRFWGKSLSSAKSRHLKVSKMVRQVYISQKMPSVDMILCFEKICANTIFVKKKNFKFLVIMLLKLESFWNQKELSMFP